MSNAYGIEHGTQLGSASSVSDFRREVISLLLEKLRERDELFDYNVSSDVIGANDYGRIFGHLCEVYYSKEFVVDGPETVGDNVIGQYIKSGDKVIMKEDFERVGYKVNKGDRGTVVFIGPDYPAVRFDGRYSIDDVDLEDLIVVGREKSFLRKAREYPPTPATDFKLEKNDIVRYCGEGIIDYTVDVPAGSEGMVVRKSVYEDRDGKRVSYLLIDWKEGKVQGSRFSCFYYLCNCIKLVRKNDIDLDELYKECLQEIRGKEND